ncbi:MAG: hypothetical protein ABI461_00240 [Polyangiaceae bacterium]
MRHPAGTAAHQSNVSQALFASRIAELATLVLGLVLIMPKKAERSWFRWTGWLAFFAGTAMLIAAIFGLFGLAIHHGMVLFDPTCPLDGPCDRALRPCRRPIGESRRSVSFRWARQSSRPR